MIPRKLTITGFLSYRKPVTIDFTQISLACISGENGAGKSSILDAMTWALFGKARRQDEAVINLHEKAAKVELEFEYEGNIYRVVRVNPRGKSQMAEFFIRDGQGAWKPLSERRVRDTNQRIIETLHMDYDTFINASFFTQGNADNFTRMSPSQRKEVLANILGLDVWEQYRQQAVEKRKQVEIEIERLRGEMESIEAELAEEDERRAHLAELQARLTELSQARELHEKNLQQAQIIHAALENQRRELENKKALLKREEEALEEYRQRLETRQAEEQEFLHLVEKSAEIEAGYHQLQEKRAELEKLNQLVETYNQLERERQAALNDIRLEQTRLEGERKNLQEKADQAQASAKGLTELEATIQALEAEVAKIEAQVAQRELLDEELEKLTAESSALDNEIERFKAERYELRQRVKTLKKLESPTCPTCGKTLSEDEKERLIADLTEQGVAAKNNQEKDETKKQELDAKIRELRKQKTEIYDAENSLRRLSSQLEGKRNEFKSGRELIEKWEAEGAPRLAEIDARLKAGDFAHEARKTLKRVEQAIAELGYDAETHRGMRQQVSEMAPLEEQFHKLEQARASLEPLRREIATLGQDIEKRMASLTALRTEYDQAAAEYAANAAGAPDIETARRELFAMREQESRLHQEVGQAQQRVNVLAERKKRKRTLLAMQEELFQKKYDYQALEKAFGKNGIQALLIEQAIPEIEIAANELLERLSDGNMSIKLITQREYKDKKRDDLKETLDIQISDSAGVRDYEMYSGGEAFRVDFALRMALSEILAQRAGARLQTLVIDEGFGSQDQHGRMRLVQAINHVRDDFAKILVITHLEELKEYFPNRIEVVKTPQGSQVTVV